MSYNILIVDDSSIVRSVLKKTLHMANIPIDELYEAPDGKEALDVLRGMWIDLVFTDINMPGMGGVEMVQIMHDEGIIKTVPVIVISTEGSVVRMDEMKKLGVRAYLRKPFSPEGVKEVVDSILGEKIDE